MFERQVRGRIAIRANAELAVLRVHASEQIVQLLRAAPLEPSRL